MAKPASKPAAEAAIPVNTAFFEILVFSSR
jgi:hypothetical protein